MSSPVLKIRIREDAPARLRSAGFESCVVRSPMWTGDDSLDWFFRHPARVNASVFVSAVLAACLKPARRRGEVEALPQSDRARLRLALVRACGREREWRKLHGSHLTADERLMAVMVWRWREHERTFARLRERHHELVAAGESMTKKFVGHDIAPAGVLGRSAFPADLLGVGVTAMVNEAAKSLSPYTEALQPFAGYTKALQPFAGYSRALDPSAGYTRALDLSAGYTKALQPFAGYTKALHPFAGYTKAAAGLADPVGIVDAQRSALLLGLRDAQRAALVEPDGSIAGLLLEGVVLRLQADLRWLEACARHWNLTKG